MGGNFIVHRLVDRNGSVVYQKVCGIPDNVLFCLPMNFHLSFKMLGPHEISTYVGSEGTNV